MYFSIPTMKKLIIFLFLLAFLASACEVRTWAASGNDDKIIKYLEFYKIILTSATLYPVRNI